MCWAKIHLCGQNNVLWNNMHKTSIFLFFSNFGFRENLISRPGILEDRSSSNIQCAEGSYNTQQINTTCFLDD